MAHRAADGLYMFVFFCFHLFSAVQRPHPYMDRVVMLFSWECDVMGLHFAVAVITLLLAICHTMATSDISCVIPQTASDNQATERSQKSCN
jgi:hypothetical protein